MRSPWGVVVLLKCCAGNGLDLEGAIGTGKPRASKDFFLSPQAGTEGGAVEIRGFDEAVKSIKTKMKK